MNMEKSFNQFNEHTCQSLENLKVINGYNLQESVDHLLETVATLLVSGFSCIDHIRALTETIGQENFCYNHNIIREEHIELIRVAVQELEILEIIMMNDEHDAYNQVDEVKVKDRLPNVDVLDNFETRERLPNIS